MTDKQINLTERRCSHPGCERPYSAKGVCHPHYIRLPEVKERKNAAPQEAQAGNNMLRLRGDLRKNLPAREKLLLQEVLQ